MLNLMIKDIVIQKRTVLMGFLFVIVMAFSFGNGGPSIFAATFAVTILLIQTPCAYDDRNRAEAMLNSLPIRRSTIVNAKFVSVLLDMLIAVGEYTIVYGIVTLIGLPLRVSPLSLENMAELLIAVTLFASIFYPIFFRFGYMKTRYINILMFAGFFGVGSALVVALKSENGLQGAKGFIDALNSQPEWLVMSGVLGLALGLMLVSYLLSVRFYNRREF